MDTFYLNKTKQVEAITSWLRLREGVHVSEKRDPMSDDCIETSKQIIIRFTTKAMSDYLPNTEGGMSGWNNGDHYFYEVKIGRDSGCISMTFAMSGEGLNDELRAKMEKIYELSGYGRNGKENWKWRTSFRTGSYKLGDSVHEADLLKVLEDFFRQAMLYEQHILSRISLKKSN